MVMLMESLAAPYISGVLAPMMEAYGDQLSIFGNG